MKKLIMSMALCAICKIVLGQAPLSKQETRFDFFELAIGGDALVINNQAFNNWTQKYYHNRQPNNLAGMASFYFVGKDYDGGIQLITGNELYQTVVFYLGRRVTPRLSPVTSFINIGLGSFIDDVYKY